MPLYTGAGFVYTDPEKQLARKFDKEGVCVVCKKEKEINYIKECEGCYNEEIRMAYKPDSPENPDLWLGRRSVTTLTSPPRSKRESKLLAIPLTLVVVGGVLLFFAIIFVMLP